MDSLLRLKLRVLIRLSSREILLRMATSTEKMTVWLSALALAVSIASPVATYFWLDPKIKETNDKRLIYSVGDNSRHLLVSLGKRKSKEFGGKSSEGALGSTEDWHIDFIARVQNIGLLPVKDIVVTVDPALPPDTRVDIDPRVPFDRKDDKSVTYISLKQALGPAQKIEAHIESPYPQGVWHEFSKQEEEGRDCVFEGDAVFSGCEPPPTAFVSSEVGLAAKVPFRKYVGAQ